MTMWLPDSDKVAHSIKAAVVVGNKFCMYKSFRFVLINESFPNPAKFQIRPNFGRSRISAGFAKTPDFGQSQSRTPVQP